MTHYELHALIRKQFDHTVSLMEGDHWQISDDGYDYLQGALHLSRWLVNIDYTEDPDTIYPALLRILPFSRNFPCDGVCDALYEWETVKRLREAVQEGNDDDKAEMEEYITDIKIVMEEHMARKRITVPTSPAEG